MPLDFWGREVLSSVISTPEIDELVGLGQEEEALPNGAVVVVSPPWALCFGKLQNGFMMPAPLALLVLMSSTLVLSFQLGSLYPTGASKSTLQSVSMMHAASCGLTSFSIKW
jgi:hypothetical protein